MSALTRTLLICAVSAPLLALTATAGAQSPSDLSNRLSRLENEIQTMSRALYKGEKPPASSFSGSASSADAAESIVRIQALEAQIQTLTGKIEEQGFELTQLKNKIDRMTADYELRLKDIESRAGGGMGGSLNGMPAATSASPTYTAPSYPAQDTAIPQPAPAQGGGYQFSTNNVIAPADAAGAADSTNTLGTLTESGAGPVASGDAAAAAYENAFSLLKAGNYDAAQREFDAFLQKNPDHVLAGNAKYWLGESYYARADYEKAARIFAEAYQKYPDGSKSADNLLKLGLSLAATGNNTDACVAFRQLEKDYKSGAGPVLRRAQQEMSKLGC